MPAFRNLFRPLLLAAALTVGTMTAATYCAAQGQPEMNEAMEHLKEARASLEHASSHHGGHREAAIKLVDQAMQEVKEGKEWARTHHEDKDHDRDHD